MGKAKTTKTTAKKAAKKRPAAKAKAVETPLPESSASNEKVKSDTPLISDNQQGSTPQIESPAANIIWRGDKPPPAKVRIVMKTITLPDAETQAKGFYIDQPGRLVNTVKGYKYFNR